MFIILRHIVFIFSLVLPCLVFGQVPVTLKDTNFRNCLYKKYPSVLNSSKQLVPSQAATLKPLLSCENTSISNVEGLQYFTSLTSINLNTNKLTYLPDLSDIKNLKFIDVSINQLAYLPDISQLKRLELVVAYRNLIKSIPDLSLNDSLKELNFHTNLLDTLPDLENLKQLRYLNILSNNFKHLPPGISELIKLETLIAWDNKLLDLPSLVKLTNLKKLDLSRNQLKVVPLLPLENKINTLFLDRNQINTWPDNLKLDSLTDGNIFNNLLSFTQLLKIKAPVLLSVFPQQTFKVGKTITIKEGSPLLFSTKIDQGLTAVSYEWYKSGERLTTVLKDSFLIPNAFFQDSGKYTCRIMHPSFPGKSLNTDTFYVRIIPCLEMPQLSIVTTEVNCTKTGSIAVKSGNNNSGFSYHLKAGNSNRIYTSATGVFTGLTEPRYSLTLQSGKCAKTYSKEIILPVQECKDFLITPDNDGNMDSFYFSASGTVKIFDKKGVPVKEMKIPGEWDCSTENGLVPIGYYIAYINEGESQIGLSVMY